VSETSFDVDYVSGGVKKTWTSTERREFDTAEYELQTFGFGDFRWRLITTYADRVANGFSRRLDYTGTVASNHRNDGPQWERMLNSSSTVYSDQVVVLHDVAWGRNGARLHPRVQAFYSVAANETRTARFQIDWEQFVWNVWSDGNWPNYSNHRNQFQVRLDRNIYIDFSRNTAGTPVWSSNTAGNPGAYKIMQDDGNLVIYSKKKALWASNTAGNPGARLTMQNDGNLVIYSKDGRALWASDTYGNPGATKTMKSDGNLVITSKDGRTLWSSNTAGNPGATDIIQDDGNYVIYAKEGTPLWASNTGGNSGARLTMQNDGNLVIYSKDGRALWASDTYGNPGAYDVMLSDGNYVIFK